MNNGRVATCADRLKEVLYVKNMRPADLCRLAQISRSYLSHFLSGDFEPKQDKMHVIAKVLNISEAWLYGYDVPMERDENIPTDETMNLTNSEKMLVTLFRCVNTDEQKLALQLISELILSEEEKSLIELFRRIPDDKRELALQMIRLAAGKQE